ncbi:MAG: hypothetical protein QOF19_3200, partial [Alphaproteobacteria bacterium]|nr:hypothetical protein [Alphaproteobacteria bacterium]
VEGCSPGPDFDAAWYLAQYPDVAAAKLNPLVHYIRWGAIEGRGPGSVDKPAAIRTPQQAGNPFTNETSPEELEDFARRRLLLQRERDFVTLRDDSLFDAKFYLSPSAAIYERDDAIVEFLDHWDAQDLYEGAAQDYMRRPCAGFHPKIYAHENSEFYYTLGVNPLSHFIRSGKPDGPWCHEVITPNSGMPAGDLKLRVAIHGHFYYADLAKDFLSRVSANRTPCDLFLTTDDGAKSRALRKVTRGYDRGEVSIRIVPNRGRDIGALLTAFGPDLLNEYDIIGHVHGKRSLAAGDQEIGKRWREFLWQNLLGDSYPMMDVIIGSLAADKALGLVFPCDPHVVDWDHNRKIAESLARRMGIEEQLPPFFDFPVGTMFWCRANALRPLFDLKLGWEDYPDEPIASDGTILHAVERLLPFVVQKAGYRFCTTYVPDVTR